MVEGAAQLYRNGGEKLQFGSEFGTYPVSFYASLRWYF